MAEETKIIRIVIDSSRAVDGSAAATRALERMEKAQADAVSGLDRLEKSLGRIGGYMKAQLALLVGEVASRVVQMGTDAFNAASGMGELADQLGITTRGLQALQYSAVQNGLKMEQLETGVGKFSQKIGEAADGSKEMIESLDRIGVKILDFQGQLRPTETLMTEVARGIVAIEDPAKRAAAAVDFFGKAGTRMLPLLAEMAKGQDYLAAQTERAGGMMSESTIERLDKIADRLERSKLEHRAYFANIIADAVDWLDKLDGQMRSGADKLNAALKDGLSGFGDWLRPVMDEAALAGGRFVVTFVSYFKGLPEQLPKLFVDALNASIAAVESGLNVIGSTIATRYPWLAGKAGISGDMVSFGRIGGGGANTASDRFAAANQAGAAWEAGKRAEYAEFYARQKEERDRANLIARQAGFADDEDRARRGRLGAVDGSGRSNPTVKGSGDAAADRRSKALGDSARELEQARAFAEAANQGADAVARLEIHFKALKTAQDVFGKAANDNTKGVAELTAKLEEQALATLKLKNLGDFRAGTAALRDQNELLEAEVRLANELPDIRARELAALKVMQEVRAKGLADNKEEIADRLAVMETNERLKTQAEEIKRANEMWTEPLKSALQSIQASAADMWEKILENGKFSMEEFGQLFIRTARRAAAELLALSTIRPVIGMGVEALGSIGLVSPGTASALGYGSAGGGGGSSGGGFSMPSLGGGGFGNLFGGSSGIGSWLKSPISGNLPSGQYGPPAPGQSFSSGWLGDITWGQGIGAAAGAGMGIYQLATANGNMGKTIGGIGSIIGAGVSLIPGIGQIAGPIISILSSIVPSLFGEPERRTHSSTNASLRYGGGSWYTTGGAYGPGANSGQTESALRGTTAGIDALFDLMGGVKDPSKVWGLNLNSWTAQGKDWSYTSQDTALVDPTTGNTVSWRMNEDNMMDTGSAQLVVRSILSGAVGEISESMKIAATAMTQFAPTLKEVADNVTFVEDVYDRLGKGALTVRAQFRELEKSFSDMTATAEKLGLSLEPVIAEQKKATERLGRDYIDNLIDPIAAQLRAWQDEKASILANVDYIGRHTDVVVDMARINEALLRKEAALKEQLYGGAISQLEGAIKRLTYGDLSNITGAGQLAGMRASFAATVAQARAGDVDAYGRVASEGLALTDASRGYYASSAEYEAIRREILAIFTELQLQVSGGTAASPSDTSAANAATAANLNTTAQLQAMVRDLAEQLAESKRDQAETNDLIRRLLSRAA